MRVVPAGYQGLLVECDDLEQVIALHRALDRDRPAGVVDLVPAARTLLVTFEPTTTHGRLRQAIADTDLTAPIGGTDAREVTIDVTYDGADLAHVAEQAGIPPEEVVRRHQAASYVVAFTGFSPGFAYLAGGDPALAVSRRRTPRTRVPAGSVALAGEFTGVYPRQGPGGWQLIGRTSAPLWDLGRTPPALLAPGTRVRFTGAPA
jgi:KipI family sensor histidine kinase inhibitor